MYQLDINLDERKNSLVNDQVADKVENKNDAIDKDRLERTLPEHDISLSSSGTEENVVSEVMTPKCIYNRYISVYCTVR